MFIAKILFLSQLNETIYNISYFIIFQEVQRLLTFQLMEPKFYIYTRFNLITYGGRGGVFQTYIQP